MSSGQTFRNTLVILLTLLVAYVLVMSAHVIMVLLIAVIIASALRPVVTTLTRRRIPLGLAIFTVYGSLAVAIILIGIVVIPPLVNQTAQYIENENRLAVRIITAQRWVESLISDVTDNEVSLVDPENIRAGVSDFVKQFRRVMPSMVDDIGATISELILVFVMGAYWLTSHTNAIAFMTQLAPPRYRQTIEDVIEKIESTMGGYVRGIGLISIIVGFLNFVALQFLNVPNALLIGFLIGIATTIPMIGGLLGSVMAVIVTLVSAPYHIVTVILVTFIIQQIESYILSPRIMSGTVGIDPLLVIVYTSIGFVMFGVVGALIAIPIMGTVHIIMLDLILEPYKRSIRQFDTQDGIPVLKESDLDLASLNKKPPTPQN